MTTLWIPTWLGTKISIECSVYLRCRVIYLFGGVNHLHPFVKSQEHEGGPDQTDLDLRVHRVHLGLTYYMSWRVYKWSLTTKVLVLIHRIVTSSNACCYLGNQLFVKRSQYIGIEIPYISSLKKPACTSKGDVLELAVDRVDIFISGATLQRTCSSFWSPQSLISTY